MALKITSYKMVSKYDCSDLNNDVNHYLNQGWELYKKPIVKVNFDTGETLFIQALVKRENAVGGK